MKSSYWRSTVFLMDPNSNYLTRIFAVCTQNIWAASWQNQQNGICTKGTQISLGICPVWSESSLSAWKKLGTLATQWAHSEDSDQNGRMPRLIWVFAGCTDIILVLSWGGSMFRIRKRIRKRATCLALLSVNTGSTTVKILKIWTPKK